MSHDQSTDVPERGYWARRLPHNPEWWETDPDECCVCGRDAVPVLWDSVAVETPDGFVYLSLDDPSCLTCRVNAVENLAERSLNQRGLEQYAEWALLESSEPDRNNVQDTESGPCLDEESRSV